MIKVAIKDILEKKDKSIYWVAETTGKSYSSLYNLINNKTKAIHFETLETVMKALEVDDFNKILKIVPSKEE